MKTLLLSAILFIYLVQTHAQDRSSMEKTFAEQSQKFFDSCRVFNLKKVSVEQTDKWAEIMIVDLPGEFNNINDFTDSAKKKILVGTIAELSGRYTSRYNKFWGAQLSLEYIVRGKGKNEVNYLYGDLERLYGSGSRSASTTLKKGRR